MPIDCILAESHICFMSIQRSKKRKQKVEWEERETEMGRNPLSATSICTLIYYTQLAY